MLPTNKPSQENIANVNFFSVLIFFVIPSSFQWNQTQDVSTLLTTRPPPQPKTTTLNLFRHCRLFLFDLIWAKVSNVIKIGMQMSLLVSTQFLKLLPKRTTVGLVVCGRNSSGPKTRFWASFVTVLSSRDGCLATGPHDQFGQKNWRLGRVLRSWVKNLTGLLGDWQNYYELSKYFSLKCRDNFVNKRLIS